MKNVLALIAITIGGFTFGQSATGDVLGQVIDKDKEEKIYWAVATIESNGTKYQARTDDEGKFRISGIPSGKYLMTIIRDIDTVKNIKVDVPIDGYDNLGVINFKQGATVDYDGIVVNGNKLRLKYGELPTPEMTQAEIEKSPLKFDIAGLVAAMSSEVKVSADGELMFRGARKGDMIYMMDGIKSNSISNVPSAAIGRIKVYTGGLPAKYGDTLGGAVVMETLSYFDLYRQYEAIQLTK